MPRDWVLASLLALASLPAAAVVHADDADFPVMDDPIAIPAEWSHDAHLLAAADAAIGIVQDRLLEPWAIDGVDDIDAIDGSNAPGTRGDNGQLDCDCVCGDVLTPTDWR